jgi:hypothetical protein
MKGGLDQPSSRHGTDLVTGCVISPFEEQSKAFLRNEASIKDTEHPLNLKTLE